MLEIQHDRSRRGIPTLTGEEVTIRREKKDGVVVIPKRKL
jgi:hypothetical protein